MKMRKKLIAVIAALVLVVALVPVAVMAEPDMASRSLPDSVLVNEEFDVTITLETTFGNVVETLPAGFTYVSCEAGSNMPEGGVEGEITGIGEVTFTFFALATPATFTYKVEAPSSPVTDAAFSGVIKYGSPVTEEAVIGDETMDVVSVEPEEPELKELVFTGDLDKGVTETFTPDIPAGVIDLEITLTATADIDLELWDGTTHVIGWHGEIDSAPGGTYQDDTFEYSGYKDGDEYITQEADGPLGRAYTLKVFGYKAGDYEVTVSYTIPVGVDLTPPEITITAPGGTVGSPVTITVSATDDTGVAHIWFGVWPSDYELTYSQEDYQYVISMASGPGALVSVTFTPSSANSYYVAAWAGDTVGNWTPEDAPVTATWVVTE